MTESSVIDPTPYIGLTPKPRPGSRLGKEPRVMIGATVDTATESRLTRWESSATLSRGLVIDQVVTHAAKTKFRPRAPSSK